MYSRLVNISNKRSFFLFGARATGKTTLLKELFKEDEVLYINLLNTEIYSELQAYPSNLYDLTTEAIKNKKFIIIDEVQKVPEILDIVHDLIQSKKAKFGLTGSSARKLKTTSANLLAGRASVYKLFPLTYLELKEDFNLDNYLSFGGLPEIFDFQTKEEKIIFLKSYAETYLEEEIVREQIIRKLPPFRRFLQVASIMNSKIINYSKIGRDIQTDPSVVKNYFDIIEDTLLGFRLDNFSTSIRKRQRLAPKFYWFDTGVTRALQKFLTSPLNKRTSYYGDLFEAFVITQIRYYLEYQIDQFSLSYLKTKDGAEIDLIIERAGKKTLCIEIKSSDSVKSLDLNNLRNLSKDISNSLAICLYTGKMNRTIDGIQVMPWEKIFEVL